MIVRVGIPALFQRFCQAAVDVGAAVMVSANALFREGRFRHPARGLFRGADVALDSAGFVAMVRYWGYRWSLDAYVALARSYPWAWWAAPDYCCEPEIARDRAEVIERVKRTAAKLYWAQTVAFDRGAALPLPVLQGWLPDDDYRRCADLMGNLPLLVGIGSVCRRNLAGADGVVAVLEALDRHLDRSIRFHLFGVKGAAIRDLVDHPRIYSVDSMAWDQRVRRAANEEKFSRTGDRRAAELRRWYLRQMEHIA